MRCVLLLYFALCFAASAQQKQLLHAKVSASANGLDGVTVINLRTENSVHTESGGYFSIPALTGDTLMLSSPRFKALKKKIIADDFNADPMIIRLEPVAVELDEVTVMRYDHINAVDLGIVPRTIKRYTPAERHYHTATDLDAHVGLNTSLSIDPLLNLLSGRTVMLLKEIAVERKEAMIAKIESLFESDYFLKKLHIPAEYVRGFEFYLVENAKFAAAIDDKNITMATFLMGELAISYLDNICEK